MRKLAIKICGITNARDAALACELGADYIGIIFAKGTPRAIDLQAAKEVRRSVPSNIKLVGVFVNSTASEIASIQEEISLDIIQFHGTEEPELISQFRPNIRAVFNVPSETEHVDLFLIDKPKVKTFVAQGAGDRGDETDPIDLACSFRHPFLFAGGLNAENVSAQINKLIENDCFAGVDVSSGIEREPRHKDHEKMRLFIQRAREAIENAIVG